MITNTQFSHETKPIKTSSLNSKFRVHIYYQLNKFLEEPRSVESLVDVFNTHWTIYRSQLQDHPGHTEAWLFMYIYNRLLTACPKHDKERLFTILRTKYPFIDVESMKTKRSRKRTIRPTATSTTKQNKRCVDDTQEQSSRSCKFTPSTIYANYAFSFGVVLSGDVKLSELTLKRDE